MSDLDFLEIVKTFDVYLALLENPSVSAQTTTENVGKAFRCAQFIESTISKAEELGKEDILESHLHAHWMDKQRSILYKCSELKNACDKLLELYLKDNSISTEIVDEFLKLYTNHCGSDRLNSFLQRVVVNGVCTNIIIQSLLGLGVPESDMQDEALILSWEVSIGTGNQHRVSENIRKMFEDGYVSKLIQFAINASENSKVKQLILQLLSNKLTENDATVCLALLDIKKQLLCELMESDDDFCLNFLDAIFYFARNMKLIEKEWSSNYEFKYKHLLQVTKHLLSGPDKISDMMYDRIQLLKSYSNGAIWLDIEKDVGVCRDVEAECTR